VTAERKMRIVFTAGQSSLVTQCDLLAGLKQFGHERKKENKMELVMFNNSSEARRAMAVKMFRYQEWCRQMDFDAEDENNWNSFCEGQQG